MVERLRFERFGNEPMDLDKARILAANVLEFGAELLRGRWNPPKGRINSELVHLVNRIQQYAFEPLTPSEMHKAVTHAGLSMPDDDTWRVWLHKARKKKLVDPPTIWPREIELTFKPDGSFDLSSLDPVSRRVLVRALRKLDDPK